MFFVKNRLTSIKDILILNKTTTFEYTNIEFIVLQFRKIIEHIALGSLVANEEKYVEVYEKFENHWNAKLIFRDIERLNPDFFPKAIRIEKSQDGDIDSFIDIKEDVLTQKEALIIYNKSSKLLHAFNPYSRDLDINYYKKAFPQWYKLIMNLTTLHVIRLYNEKYMYYVAMNESGKMPSGNIFEQIG